MNFKTSITILLLLTISTFALHSQKVEKFIELGNSLYKPIEMQKKYCQDAFLFQIPRTSFSNQLMLKFQINYSERLFSLHKVGLGYEQLKYVSDIDSDKIATQTQANGQIVNPIILGPVYDFRKKINFNQFQLVHTHAVGYKVSEKTHVYIGISNPINTFGWVNVSSNKIAEYNEHQNRIRLNVLAGTNFLVNKFGFGFEAYYGLISLTKNYEYCNDYVPKLNALGCQFNLSYRLN